MRTPEEIKGEIAMLRSMKPSIPRRSAFGDDHHDAVDAQIETLEEALSEEEIYDRHDSATEDEIWAADNVLDAALEASRWMSGEDDELPSEGWESLT